MKVLIVGGASGGKRAHAARAYPHARPVDPRETGPDTALASPHIDRLHELVRALLERGEPDPVTRVLTAVETHPDWLLLCDEVGCGVVPVDRFERDWRDAVGRLCRALATRADRVERVCCGVATHIKG